MKSPVLGILDTGGKRVAVSISRGAIVHVMSGPRPDDRRMVDVHCEGQSLVMFAIDLSQHGEEVTVTAS
jgi:hypothetical protein